MSFTNPEVMKKILSEAKTIAVVGLSSDPGRASHSVSKYIQSKGYRIIPVNPNELEVLGEKAYPTLRDVPEKIDLVNIFRRPEEAGQFVDEAVAMGVKAVWMQDGVIDRAAAQRALDAGLDVVMDDCILRQHIRLNR
jgi:predicted CoA-binding protein